MICSMMSNSAICTWLKAIQYSLTTLSVLVNINDKVKVAQTCCYIEKIKRDKLSFWLVRRSERNYNHKSQRTKTRMKRWFGLVDAAGSLSVFVVLDCYRKTDCIIEMLFNADGSFTSGCLTFLNPAFIFRPSQCHSPSSTQFRFTQGCNKPAWRRVTATFQIKPRSDS